jgi:hypothetical protein
VGRRPLFCWAARSLIPDRLCKSGQVSVRQPETLFHSSLSHSSLPLLLSLSLLVSSPHLSTLLRPPSSNNLQPPARLRQPYTCAAALCPASPPGQAPTLLTALFLRRSSWTVSPSPRPRRRNTSSQQPPRPYVSQQTKPGRALRCQRQTLPSSSTFFIRLKLAPAPYLLAHQSP